MSTSFFNIPNFYTSGIPEKSSGCYPPHSLPQDNSLSPSIKIVLPPPGFSLVDQISESEMKLAPEPPKIGKTDNILPANYQNFGSSNSLNRILKSLPIQNQVVPQNFYKQFHRGCYSQFSQYRYMKYRHFSDRRKKIFQKSAYILASIQTEYFKELGAVEYVKGICIILRQYEQANSSRETCAIIGLNKQWFHQLSYRFSNLYNILRSLSILNHIPGIQDLSPYKLNVMKNFTRYINDLDDNELILLNIEPKGQTTRSQHYYPTANLCLPGGGMETEDEFDLKKTAFREFEEETGFRLDEKSIQIIDQQKWNGTDREAMYIIIKVPMGGAVPAPSTPR